MKARDTTSFLTDQAYHRKPLHRPTLPRSGFLSPSRDSIRPRVTVRTGRKDGNETNQQNKELEHLGKEAPSSYSAGSAGDNTLH